MKKMSRREFASLTASVMAVLAAPRTPGQALRIRRNIIELNPAEIATFRAGFGAMQGLGVLDIRSVEFQANVHGAPWGWEEAYPVFPPGVDIYWNQCQHGNAHFLTWHRWYLLYWEEIVRQLCGDGAFNLPYWDVVTQGYIPSAFRIPADSTNSLYNSSRLPALNSGTAQISNVHNQCIDYLSFGSFSGSSGLEDGLEKNPHNMVHNQIGGWFGDVERAGRDPLFFLHHCNVDRYWHCWLGMGGGRANPADAAWLNETFDFQSLAGPQSPVVSDGLTAPALGYTYDACPVNISTWIPPWLHHLKLQRWPVLKTPRPDPPPPWLRTVLAFEPLTLDGNDNAFVIPRAVLDQARITESTAAFLLAGLEMTETAKLGGFYFEVWLAPDAAAIARKGVEGAARLGTFGAFELSGLRAHATHGGAHLHHGVTPPLSLPLSRAAIDILRGKQEPALVFARRGAVDREGKDLPFDTRPALVRVETMSLVAGR